MKSPCNAVRPESNLEFDVDVAVTAGWTALGKAAKLQVSIQGQRECGKVVRTPIFDTKKLERPMRHFYILRIKRRILRPIAFNRFCGITQNVALEKIFKTLFGDKNCVVGGHARNV